MDIGPDSISVIIPCHNGWKYMGKCLSALESQTVLPYEVIIIDDASTDDTYEQLVEYTASSKLDITLLQNKKNLGPAASRKKGIDYSKGYYLAFCDCDDWYESRFVETMQKAISDSWPDMVLFDNYNSFFDGRRYRQGRTQLELQRSKTELMIEANHSLCRLVAHRSLFAEVQYVDLRHEEDAVVVVQLILKAKTIQIVNEALYNYFFRDDSLSKKDSPDIYKDEIKAYIFFRDFLHEKYKQEVEFIGIRLICYSAALYAIRAGVSKSEINAFLCDFESEYPTWEKNRYLSLFGVEKRAFLRIVKHRRFFIMRSMAACHHYLAKMKRYINR